MLNDPVQVLQLQVGDAYVPHHTLTFQFVQGRQRLVDHLLQATLHAPLELDVVDVDDVDVVDVQALQALVDTLLGTSGGIVPRVDTVLAVASYLGGEKELVAGDVLQGLAQYRLGLVVTVVWGYVDDVDTSIDGSKHGVDASVLVERMEHTTQRRGAEAQLRHLHSCFS